MAFAGKVALITGAGKLSGIGAACARSLGVKGAKARARPRASRSRPWPELLRTPQVMLCDINSAGAEEAAAVLRSEGIDAAACGGDVGTCADADGMVAAAVRAFGSLDVLVANAGIVRAAPFLEMTEARRVRDSLAYAHLCLTARVGTRRTTLTR